MDTSIHYGLTLSSEEHAPRRLVEIAVLAEEHGFDFVVDLRPLPPVGRRAGPLAVRLVDARRDRRPHVARSTSPSASPVRSSASTRRSWPTPPPPSPTSSPGRFSWGVGTGEALNEHILGDRWPPRRPAPGATRRGGRRHPPAVDRRQVDPRGAPLHGRERPPLRPAEHDIPIDRVGLRPGRGRGGGPHRRRAVDLRGVADIVETWRGAGGTGPVYAQVTLCWAGQRRGGDRDGASGSGPTPACRVSSARTCRRRRTSSRRPRSSPRSRSPTRWRAGRTPNRSSTAVEELVDGGVDHVYFHQIGPDQEGFCRFWTDQLASRLPGRGA